MKQTAIEWLEKRFYFTKGQLIDIDFEQAKAMEKEIIRSVYLDGRDNEYATSEEYYNELFKSE